MKIIEPKVELWKQGKDDIAHVCKCARICYRKESGNDTALYNRLVSSKHNSMFRHLSIYAVIPADNKIIYAIKRFEENPYIDYITKEECAFEEDYIYVSTNGNFMLDIKHRIEIGEADYNTKLVYEAINCYKVTIEEFEKIPIAHELMRYTFCIDTQISTSRELNRVSPNNIAEQSTRYVYEDGTICRPWWMDESIAKEVNDNIYSRNFEHGNVDNLKITEYITSCGSSFISYKRLVDKYGMSRQDARGVLPLDTATRCVYTYTVKQWRHIIDLRYYGTTGAPHPNAKIIASIIRDKLIKLDYDFRS